MSFSVSAAMEKCIASSLNNIADEELDFFGSADRCVLMDLVQDYFCGETPDSDSGKQSPPTN